MDKDVKKRLKSQSQAMRPFLIIGKNGLNDNSIQNIKKNLKSNKLTKIKIAKTYTDTQSESRKEIAEMLAEKTASQVINVVGQVVVLYKR